MQSWSFLHFSSALAAVQAVHMLESQVPPGDSSDTTHASLQSQLNSHPAKTWPWQGRQLQVHVSGSQIPPLQSSLL